MHRDRTWKQWFWQFWIMNTSNLELRIIWFYILFLKVLINFVKIIVVGKCVARRIQILTVLQNKICSSICRTEQSQFVFKAEFQYLALSSKWWQLGAVQKSYLLQLSNNAFVFDRSLALYSSVMAQNGDKEIQNGTASKSHILLSSM